MPEEERFRRWSLEKSDLDDLTPEKARDLIIKCFFEAQKETFARTRQGLGISFNDGDLRATVEGSIKLAFKTVGEDISKPSKAGLMRVVESLSKKAASWGTPQDIIDYHKSQIAKIIDILKG
ncbi:MAG: hypothetical protein M0Z60_00655 [Nitrospiraceae bacterium]|nr:hypothetical protein [Nitrospiraceae bacterium]